jgi:hypothetical protein
MGQNGTEPKSDCQLQVVYESAEPLRLSDKIRNGAARLIRALYRRLPQCAQGTPPSQDMEKPAIAAGSSAGSTIRAGDWVEVLPYEEILKTLDDRKRCQGLEFMAGMEKYTGKRFQVLKRVLTMFDERAWKMVRLKNTVILRDVLCDGQGMYDREGCDRCCFYFWKEQWLRKI